VPWSSETARGRNTFRKSSPPEMAVDPPGWLADEALDYWLLTAPSLIASGRLRTCMATAYAILCELATDCERLSREVAVEGQVVPSPRGVKANPKVRLLRDARRDFLQVSKSFGLDPCSASRLSAAPSEPEEPDPLEEYIRSRGA